MTFRITTSDDKDVLSRPSVPDYDPELDDVSSVLSDLCSWITDAGAAHFKVDCCGLRWPVDVRTDLAIILPQIPEVLGELSERGSARLQFFEQGIERDIGFTASDEDFEVDCRDLWGNPIVGAHAERIKKTSVYSELSNLALDFINFVEARYPEIAVLPLYKQWRTSVFEQTNRVRAAN